MKVRIRPIHADRQYFSTRNESAGSGCAAFWMRLPSFSPSSSRFLSSTSSAISSCRSCCCPPPATTTRPCPTTLPFSTAKKSRTPHAAKPAANPLTFPSTPARVCAPPTMSRTTRQLLLLQGTRSPDRSALSPVAAYRRSPANHPGHERRPPHEYPVVDAAAVHDPDEGNKIKHVIEAAKEDTEVFPHLNNYNPNTQSWDPAIGVMLADPAKRAALRQQIVRFLTPFPPIAAYRSTSKACPTMPRPAISASSASFTPTCIRAISASTSTPWSPPPTRTERHCRQLRWPCPDELRRAPGREPAGPSPARNGSSTTSAALSNRPQGEADLRAGQLWLRLDALHPPKKTRPPRQAALVLNTEDSPSPMSGSAPPTPMPI